MKVLLSTLLTLLLAVPLLADQSVEEDAAGTVFVGPVIDDTGAVVTDLAAGTVDTIGIFKPGATAITDLSGTTTFTHRSDGIYTLTLSSTDTATAGEAKLVIIDADACLPESLDVHIMPSDVFKMTVDGTLEVSTDQSVVDAFWTDVTNTIDGASFKAIVARMAAVIMGERTVSGGQSIYFAIDDDTQARVTSTATEGGARNPVTYDDTDND